MSRDGGGDGAHLPRVCNVTCGGLDPLRSWWGGGGGLCVTTFMGGGDSTALHSTHASPAQQQRCIQKVCSVQQGEHAVILGNA